RREPGVLAEIRPYDRHSRDRIHRQQIDGGDGGARAETLAKHLAPASRRGTEVRDAHSRPEQVVAVGELEELECGARAVAAARCLLDPGIVDVPGHPRLDELVLLRCLES